MTTAVTAAVMFSLDLSGLSTDRPRRGIGRGVAFDTRRRDGHRGLGAGATGQVHQQSGAGAGDQPGGDADDGQLLRRVLRCVHVVCSFVRQVRFTCVPSDCASQVRSKAESGENEVRIGDRGTNIPLSRGFTRHSAGSIPPRRRH